MGVDVVSEENYGTSHHLIISASGVKLHLESALECSDEVWLVVDPDEDGWEILAQADPLDPRGLRLVIRRV